LDTALHIRRFAPNVHASVRSAVVELAAFDLVLAEVLVADGATDLDALTRLLDEYSRESRFDPVSDPRRVTCDGERPALLDDAWARGLVDRFDGEPCAHWHSVCFVDEPDRSTLRRRLWRAQVNELLPTMEDWRVQLIELAKGENFIARGVPLADLDFKELHLHLRADVHSPARRAMADFAEWLRWRRNDLAHLRVVSESERRIGEEHAARCLA
jgi:hypothetical protein